jgi:hypothetical protein
MTAVATSSKEGAVTLPQKGECDMGDDDAHMLVVCFGLSALVFLKSPSILVSTAHEGPLCVGPFDPHGVYHFSIVTI